MSFTLCSNQLYLRSHYRLYFYPAFIIIISSKIVFILIIVITIVIIIIIIVTIIIIKINPPFSLSKLLKLWLTL